MKKVWTWLKEWKDRTDMEIKRLKKQLMKDARRGKITKEEAKKSKFFSLFHTTCMAFKYFTKITCGQIMFRKFF